ncbi:hypothetical protein [uncultured Dokdonia sp.]|uniref:hypothetical protein n=1 Tax=uncultured Dokdonia sp. TaxID=575653 RepID=UPI002610B536|nr:hypothetical protein [uncultured Dokdonia sp.]
MSGTVDHIENLYNKAKQYTETSIELYKLSAIDTSADVVSSLASRAILILVISTCIIFLNLGLALYLGNLLGDYFKGFLIVALFYLLLAIIIYFFNKTLIRKPITNLMITKLMKPRLKEKEIEEVIANSNNRNNGTIH